jgi:hypothetical protein
VILVHRDVGTHALGDGAKLALLVGCRLILSADPEVDRGAHGGGSRQGAAVVPKAGPQVCQSVSRADFAKRPLVKQRALFCVTLPAAPGQDRRCLEAAGFVPHFCPHADFGMARTSLCD